MAGPKARDTWQYGDFQTPPDLARQVCAVLAARGIAPGAILEPTCGRGAFLAAARAGFPRARQVLGVEINPTHVQDARARLGAGACVEQGDFFTVDWPAVLARDEGPWLVLGNPPWVTNAELGLLKSTNLPAKSNFQRHKGLDALTGKANFDISEWMLLQQLDWLRARSGWIAMLVKAAVARKILRQAWKRGDPVGRAALYRIDAMQHFGASVEACLFVLPVGIGARSRDCDVFDTLDAAAPQATLGFHDQVLVSDVPAYLRHRALVGGNRHHVWRSGVKHDCARVMELTRAEAGHYANGLGEVVLLEPEMVFPLLKSSDVARGRARAERVMLVPQREIGGDTAALAQTAPLTWHYLQRHGARLDARSSVIYRGKPRFSVFGVGAYSFAPWKVAISGFYTSFNFMKVGPSGGKPVVLDDTVYFLPCRSEAEADLLLTLVRSPPYAALLRAMVFPGDKRPVTADLLKRVSLELVASHLGLAEAYAVFADRPAPG
ncbi:MAG: SAM-dependent DNA methyltransferase [Rhodobacteraceae bacterium]|nr:MAG: SAM-dependent DNA methyltransferase [Paracoccaceae bacterium]